jgi:flavin-binding protein dodecin
VGDPSGEDEAVAPALQRGGDVIDDLGVAGVVGHEGAVDRLERVGR